MKIIPAIDIIDGKCVRLSQGDYSKQTTYNDDPVEVALEFEKKGAEYLHLVDLDGAKHNEPQNLLILNSISLLTSLKVDFGGGIKNRNSLEMAMAAGAHQANIGSLAVKNTNLVKFWISKYGREKIIISSDVYENKIAINGWTKKTEINIFDFIQDFVRAGAIHFVCTDISRDGMLEGPNFELYDQIIEKFPRIKLTASGGICSINDLLTLKEIGCDAAIVGKALYEGQFTLDEALNEVCS